MQADNWDFDPLELQAMFVDNTLIISSSKSIDNA
jgi:hypothetical protein